MPARSHRHRPFARRALLDAVGCATPNNHQLSEAFAALRARLVRSLEPIFGTVAVETLFERSRHLAAEEFSWLPALLPARTGAAPLAVAPSVSAEELLNGLAAVLAFDVGLLVGLVGHDLVLPLMQKAWGPIGRPSATADESN
jgi:hypothetical protein